MHILKTHKQLKERCVPYSSHAISADSHFSSCLAQQGERHSSLHQNNDKPFSIMVFVCTPLLISVCVSDKGNLGLFMCVSVCMHVLTNAIRWPHHSTKSNYTPGSPSAEFSCSECGPLGEPGVIRQLEHATEMGWDGWKTGEERDRCVSENAQSGRVAMCYNSCRVRQSCGVE